METLGDFARVKRSPKPFFDCGGQGCRIISVDMINGKSVQELIPV
jgi:hypothetical protein